MMLMFRLIAVVAATRQSCFFFSSRRRHTRCLSDWSSDVCSSDLAGRDRSLQHLARFARVPHDQDLRTVDLRVSDGSPRYPERQLGGKEVPSEATDAVRAK